MNTGILRAGSGFIAASGVALGTVVFPVPAMPTPNGTWTELGPPDRSLHAAVYDPVRDRMLVIASNVWALDLSPGASWHPLAVSGTPPATREWHSLPGTGHASRQGRAHPLRVPPRRERASSNALKS